jgi:uncharacterized protein YccT (UPF0319 family)
MTHLLRAVVLSLPAVLTACASNDVKLYDTRTQGQAQVAKVTMPEQLEVLSINGTQVKGASGMWTKGDRELELAPGRYAMLVFYREVWAQGEQHDVLRSDPELFVVDASAGHTYRLDYPHPDTVEEARKLAASFDGWVVDLSTGARSPSQASNMQFRRGLGSQILGGGELEPVPTTTAQGTQVVAPLAAGVEASASTAAPVVHSTAPAAVAGPDTTTVVAPLPPATPAKPAAKVTAQPDFLTPMQAWWKQATPEERRAFLSWTATQP